MTSDTLALDGCGCCEGLDEPAAVHNDPGLAALAYRVDVQPGFYARMLQSLPLARSNPRDADGPRPLARLLTRGSDDPTVAFLDASACVADVLSFYQERIANEGFLRTATERRSVLELARAIGYELKPGVAASVHLAFTVEDAPGAPGVCTLAKGTPVQSVPPQGKLPQVFETGAEIVTRAEWNALVPRQVRPADMALLDVPASVNTAAHKALVLLGPSGSFPAGTEGLKTGLLSVDLFRLDLSLAVDASVDALEVGRVFFTEAASGINGGDLLLFVGKKGDTLDKLVLRATEVVAEPALKRIRIDVEALPAAVADPPPPPVATWIVPYVVKPILSFAKPQVSTVAFTSSTITSTVASKAWRESDLQAMIGIQGWSGTSLVKTIAAAQPRGAPVAPEAGAFAFGAKLGFFGNNAPKWKILPPDTDNTHGDAYPLGWDSGDTENPASGTLPRTIWEDSQGTSIAPRTYLERSVPNVNRTSWVVFDATDVAAQAYTVLDARETSRADFGLSGRAMRLRLADANGQPLPATPAEAFRFRSSTAHVASRRLDLANLPIDAPIAAGDTQIELDRMVLGLTVGQPVALVGERFDLHGVVAAEIGVLSDIVHAEGRSTLVLKKGLTYSYLRTGLSISANVVHATHGETVNEVLGNGDGSVAHQRFTLKKAPTTHLSAMGGAKSTLEVRVAGVLWDERPSLCGAAPNETLYTTRIADDASMTLTFGDGVQGARLPSGTLNVSARYRSGIGPNGEVDAGTLTMLRAMPLGLRGVTNPIAAAGAEGQEQLADARRNAPLTLLTFERVVSLLDYENYARAFPGIGKARGDVLSVDGTSRIFLTVAGATGGPPGADVLTNLIGSIGAASDPSQRFDVGAYAQRYFSLKAKVAVDPRYVAADVLAEVSAALLAGFGFDARDLGQSVTAAEVVTLVHRVAGVVAVDLDELLPTSDDPVPADPAATAVPAFGARWDAIAGSDPAGRAATDQPGGSGDRGDAGMSLLMPERIYQLLPAIYRLRDADQGEPLRALLGVIEGELERVEADIAGLYDNWFIETCDEWVVPYIGDLLGVRPIRPVPSAGVSARAYVANTIAYRRRKGTAVVLEQLARDVTGWPARAVELFQRLATTQHMNHVRLAPAFTASVRDAALAELADGPFEPFAHTAEVRRAATRGGRFNIPNVGLYLWRLSSYRLGAGQPGDDASDFTSARNLGAWWSLHPAGWTRPSSTRSAPSRRSRTSRRRKMSRVLCGGWH